MTKAQYEKWSAPFRKKENWKKLLAGTDRLITAVIFLSYPALLAYLFFAGHSSKLLLSILLPAVSFLAVSCFRAVYSAPRPYETLGIVPLLPKETKGKSFPSRHVFSAFMVAMTFLFFDRIVGSFLCNMDIMRMAFF